MNNTKAENSAATPVAGRRFYYGYVIVAASFCIWLVSWGTNQTFGVFYKSLMHEFGWTRAETVLAFSLISIVQASLAVCMGWLTDRLGPRIVVTVFGSFLGLSYLLLSRMTALWQFNLYYSILGAVGLSTATVPIMATVARWFNKRRGLMVAIVQAGVGIGGFIFAPLSGWLIVQYGWRLAYDVLALIVLVVVITSGLLLKRDPQSIGLLPDGFSPAVMSTVQAKANLNDIGLSLKQALRTHQFWIVAGIFFSFGFCRSAFLPHIANHVQDLGFSISDGANVLAALIVSSIAGRFWLGWVDNRPAFMGSFAVTTVALIWALITRDLWGLYLFAVLFGFGWGAQAVLRLTVTSETFGLLSIGLLLGVFGFCEAAASALGSYLSGLLFDLTGSYQLAFWSGIPVSITGAILSAVLKPISREALAEIGAWHESPVARPSRSSR
jgi:MFS family permease